MEDKPVLVKENPFAVEDLTTEELLNLASAARSELSSRGMYLPEGVPPNALVLSVPEDEAQGELFRWWIGTAADDFERTVPKTLEYGGTKTGSADLQLIGENLATLLGMHDAADAVKQEMACWFYMQGKVARLVSDYQQHKQGKGDTWFDASIYAIMARRIQLTGMWP